MNFKYEAQYDALRCTLDTNQYLYGASKRQPENFGTYGCTFIAFEFLASVLKMADHQWLKPKDNSQFFLSEHIVPLAKLAIESGVERHEQHCKEGDRPIKGNRPKSISLAFENVIGYANEHGKKRIVLDVDKRRRSTVEHLILNHSPEGQNKTLHFCNEHYKEKVGYILGAKNHVVSIVRDNNSWLLFNSLPETRGVMFPPYMYYPLYKAYILFFNGPNAMRNIFFYLQNKLWRPGDDVDVYPIYEKPVHGVELDAPLTPARGPRRPAAPPVDLDISLQSFDGFD